MGQIHVGSERYLNRLWKQSYSGHIMHILRRWSDGSMSVTFERVIL
jgi:hypothetical protein